MALSYVNSASNKSSTTSVAISKPTNVADGDIMIAFVTAFRATNQTAGTVTAPAGWSIINTRAISTRYQVGLFWKRASSEGTSYSFTSTSATRMQGGISAYRGAVASGNPYSVLSNTLYSTSNTTVRAASMTPSSSGMYVFWGGWFYLSSATSLTKPTAMTLLQTQANTTNVATIAHGIFAPGTATGAQDGTASGTATVKHAYMVDILAASDTSTQTAAARVQRIETNGQTATSRIAIVVNQTQTASARIAKEFSSNQTANSRIAQIFTSEQTATAKIHVAGTGTKTQFADARILKPDNTITQLATARIQIENLTLDQSATARIQVVGATNQQTATAKILLAGVVQVNLDSPGNGVTIHNAQPAMYLTGTESSNNSIEYHIQIDTVNTFDSSSTGQPMMAKYSDSLINYRNTGIYNSAGSSTAVVPAPAGLADGDLIFVSIRRAAAVNPSSTPAGWSLLQSVLSTYGFWIYYKIANGEGSSWTWSWAASAKTQGYAYAFWGDYDHNNPIQSSTTPYSATASGTAIGIPTLTTSADKTMSVIVSSAYSTSAKTFTVPTSPTFTERSDTGNTNPDFWQGIASYIYPTANTSTGTISYPASAASTYRVGCQILVNPSPDSGFESGNPFSSGTQVAYSLPRVLSSDVYYWRVCGKAPSGTNTYGSWSDTYSFTVEDGFKVWNGSDWAYKPVKVWTGSDWKPTTSVKVWDGSQWIEKG